MKKEKKTGKTSLLFGLPLFGSSKLALLTDVCSDLKTSQEPLIIFTPNAEQVVQAKEDPDFARVLLKANYLVPDGSGIVLASWLLSRLGKARAIPTWIPGVDVVAEILKEATVHQWRVALVGGEGYGASQLQINKAQVTWIPAYANVRQPTAAEEQALSTVLKKLKPDIVFVAFGAPWQERWVIEHRTLLKQAQTKVVMAVGGSFDYLLGKVSRAPRWWRSLGMEWLYRLCWQPWRWRRQLRLITFIRLVILAVFQPAPAPQN